MGKTVLEGEKEKEERAEYYRPQLEAYAAAVAKLTGLPMGKVTTRLVWVEVSATRE